MAECQERLEATLAAYERNIAEILDRVAEAFPDATVLFLTAYNPFSYGFGEAVTFETESNAILGRLNTIATLAAVSRGFLVADGFTPMQATGATSTHMNDAEPDIHPNALGYDVLTGALWDALVGADEPETVSHHEGASVVIGAPAPPTRRERARMLPQ